MFFGMGVMKDYPKPKFGFSVSFTGGWVDGCAPSGQQTDQFIEGLGMSSTAGYYGLGGGRT